MNEREIKTKQEIIKATAAIRKKYKMLKLGRNASELNLEKSFKPITQPLNELITTVKQNKNIINPVAPSIKRKYITSPSSPFLSEDESTLKRKYVASEKFTTEDELNFETGSLSSRYISQVRRKTYNIDSVYGVRFDEANNMFMIGNKKVEFNGDDLIIGGVDYKGTPGLYELIFMKQPNMPLVTVTDKDHYKNVLIDTSAARNQYQPDRKLRGNSGLKYRDVIKPLLKSTQSDSPKLGGGIITKEVNDKPIEYVYWNTLSELVSRLRLLYASKMAGHTGHDNEISSIIEELREEGIIE